MIVKSIFAWSCNYYIVYMEIGIELGTILHDSFIMDPANSNHMSVVSSHSILVQIIFFNPMQILLLLW